MSVFFHSRSLAASMKGVTLLELMVTISILSIILFIGIPGFQSLSEGARQRAASSTLETAVNLARSEAITRGVVSRVCISASCANGFSGVRVQSEDGGAWELIREWEGEGNINYVLAGGGNPELRFSPIGLAVTAQGAQLNNPVSISVNDTRSGSVKTLSSYCVSVTGSIAKGGCN